MTTCQRCILQLCSVGTETERYEIAAEWNCLPWRLLDEDSKKKKKKKKTRSRRVLGNKISSWCRKWWGGSAASWSEEAARGITPRGAVCRLANVYELYSAKQTTLWSQPELLRRGVAIEVADFIILPHSFPNENELNFWTRQFASLKAKIATNALDMNGSVDVMRSVSRIHIRIQKNTCLMSWCPKVLTFSGTVRKCAIKPWTIRTIDLTAFSIKCQLFSLYIKMYKTV